MTALGVLCAVTACANNSNGAGSASATATPSATGGGVAGAAPACVSGTWRSTSTTAGGSLNGMTGTISGGQGVMLTVGADGATTVDLSSMQPMDFAATASGAGVKGQYSYAGSISGTMQFSGAASQGSSPPPGTGAPASSEQTGSWQPSGDVNWNDLRLTLKLTSPISQTLLDNARIPGVSSGQTGQAGDVVDLQPILRNGTYTCGGDTLTLRPEGSTPAVTWTFQRA